MIHESFEIIKYYLFKFLFWISFCIFWFSISKFIGEIIFSGIGYGHWNFFFPLILTILVSYPVMYLTQ